VVTRPESWEQALPVAASVGEWNMDPVRQCVLIVSDYEIDRETIPFLLGSMGCRWILTSTLEEAVGTLNRESIAAAVLDSRLIISESEEEKNQVLREILVRLPGRVILLLNETCDPRMVDFARAYSLLLIKRDRWTQDLWGSLETLLRLPTVARLTKETARLVLDTFMQPQPAGIRHSQANTRHLLYETRSLSVDVSFEPLPDSNSVLLGGQILTEYEPKRLFNGVPVRLRGQERPLGFAVTNQSGEFLFEFEREPYVKLEIEDRPNHWVTIYSPHLTWGMHDEPKSARARGSITPREKMRTSASRRKKDAP
jgi:hypothetical protein